MFERVLQAVGLTLLLLAIVPAGASAQVGTCWQCQPMQWGACGYAGCAGAYAGMADCAQTAGNETDGQGCPITSACNAYGSSCVIMTLRLDGGVRAPFAAELDARTAALIYGRDEGGAVRRVCDASVIARVVDPAEAARERERVKRVVL